MIHPAYLSFSERALGSGLHQWMRLDLRVLTKINLFDLYPVPLVVRLIDPLAYADTFDRLLNAWRGSSSLRYFHTLSLTFRLIELILGSWEQAGSEARPLASSPKEDRLLQVIHYMFNHLASPLTRSSLADLVHLHPVYLDRMFSQQYGCTMLQMLRTLRLHYARELLETTNQTLQAVALHAGLGEAQYLSRVFAQEFGMTPRQCRLRALAATSSYLSSPPDKG
jgi:AraC-like DNA-binding protein